MQIQKISYQGWENNLLLSHAGLELIVTQDVGPRVIACRLAGGHNVLKNNPSELGGSGEPDWKIRGGHRLWVAPECDLTYTPDNGPVTVEELPEEAGVRFVNPSTAACGFRKELTITLTSSPEVASDAEASEVPKATLHHRVVNESDQPMRVASWGLTVMEPGGLEIIPLPPLGQHPRDLLPNRLIVPWAYTDMTDPRWRFGCEFITLRQTAEGGPTKLGLAHKEKWIAYLNGETLFIKTIEHVEGVHYPDHGCNFETFTNAEMLEIESLSPLRTLKPGDAIEHTETWYLLGGVSQPASLHEQDLGAWLEPVLQKLGI